MIAHQIAGPAAGTLLGAAYRIFEELYKLPTYSQDCYTDAFGTAWSNPDNILGGKLSAVVFMMELYRVTGDDNVRLQVEREFCMVEEAIGDSFTMNHALFVGRSGLGHCYLEWYNITGDANYLQKALELGRAYFYGKPFQCRILDNAALYDGFSGILLFAVLLYGHTKEEWLPGFIEKMAYTLVHKCIAAENGFLWGGVTNYNKKNTGIATGASGIAWVLHQLAAMFQNTAFAELAKQALINEDIRMHYASAVTSDAAAPALRAYSFGYGIAGMALTRLYCNETSQEKKYWQAIEQVVNKSIKQFPNDAWALDICAGLPGIGIALVESYKITGNTRHYELAASLANKLSAHVDKNNVSVHELSHVGYFLLQAQGIEQKPQGSFFLPSAEIAGTVEVQENLLLHPGNNKLRQQVFRNAFSTSLSFLRDSCNKAPQIPVLSLQEGWLMEAEAFLRSFMEIELADSPELLQRAMTQLNRDRFRHKMLAADAPKYTDEKPVVQRIHKIMEADAIMSQRLMISPGIRIMDDGFVLPIDKKFTIPEFAEVIALYGMGTHFFRINAIDAIEESIPAGAAKIILDRFIQPTLVQTAQDQVVQFLLGQNEDILELLRSRPILPSAPCAQNNEELIAQISEFFMNVVRFHWMTGILELAD